MGKLFGTDGVRGIANKDLTPELANQLAKAAAEIFIKEKKGTVVIGKDTRISGDLLEAAMVSGFLAMGVEVITLGVIPTPAVAYATRKLKANMGVVISASHNPYEYNGIKFFNHQGFKLRDEIEEEIEGYISRNQTRDKCPTGDEIGRLIEMADPEKFYGDFVASTIKGDFNGMRIAMDTAHGAAYKVAPRTFQNLGAEVFVINDQPDGKNINQNCGSTHPEVLKDVVVANQCDMGISFDGDADRLIALDEKGEVVDGDQIMAICGSDLKEKGALKKDTVVATVMSNIGLDLAFKGKDIQLEKTKVGDRYVLEKMKEEGFSLGGEQSGHLIFLDHNTTGDGLLSALKLAEIVKERKEPLSTLSAIMERFPQTLVNAKVPNEYKDSLMNNEVILEEIQKAEKILDDEGRVLVRPSGTEPLVRVMIEGKNLAQIQGFAQKIAGLIEAQF
ncbi:phosphoglucosamine mutase [Isachenkonia alkalipeptolytica]|uniref:Phosphoglucosamine mutase n=1 Tax=Isachenkonia alkalipeptolytica TaxID=2565777 RepID=A0AA43XN01_9CLOT|nr:phosphoglucosamine mutase [Isachenkonia alkalipeptolytica]NBG89557.1 phosphoglucosamine mutase [Isachenkonia alkalipeptolytica]